MATSFVLFAVGAGVPTVTLVFLASTIAGFLSVVLSFMRLLRQRPHHGANRAERPLLRGAPGFVGLAAAAPAYRVIPLIGSGMGR
ncbi:MAG: hypothetical protein M3305_16500 [Actinomycetota bacterium]|nr:hypothetical protein [Actinomycetota bacterium]